MSENVLLFVDVHNFKAFNDQRGFEAGDKFLTAIAGYISEVFRGSLYGRQADDHFVVLTKTEGLTEKLDALNEKVSDYDDEILLGINCGGYHLNASSEDPRVCIDRARYAAHLIKNRFQTVLPQASVRHQQHRQRGRKRLDRPVLSAGGLVGYRTGLRLRGARPLDGSGLRTTLPE